MGIKYKVNKVGIRLKTYQRRYVWWYNNYSNCLSPDCLTYWNGCIEELKGFFFLVKLDVKQRKFSLFTRKYLSIIQQLNSPNT